MERTQHEIDYPEHARMRAVLDKSRLLGEFLDWLKQEHGVTLCRWQDFVRHSPELGDYTPEGYYEIRESFEKLLASFFEIDLDKIETEKQAMLESIRESDRANA